MTQLHGPALRMTIIVGEDDVWHHRPVYNEIVVRAREAGMSGATVTRGVEGFGRRSIVHTSRLVSLSSDLPVVITVVVVISAAILIPVTAAVVFSSGRCAPTVTPFVREDRKVGRNEPCPCGSGKKFKKCCGG